MIRVRTVDLNPHPTAETDCEISAAGRRPAGHRHRLRSAAPGPRARPDWWSSMPMQASLDGPGRAAGRRPPENRRGRRPRRRRHGPVDGRPPTWPSARSTTGSTPTWPHWPSTAGPISWTWAATTTSWPGNSNWTTRPRATGRHHRSGLRPGPRPGRHPGLLAGRRPRTRREPQAARGRPAGRSPAADELQGRVLGAGPDQRVHRAGGGHPRRPVARPCPR